MNANSKNSQDGACQNSFFADTLKAVRPSLRSAKKEFRPPVLTSVDFYGREFVINSDVLIPRPETEQMIDMVLSLVGKPYLPGVKPGEAVLPEDLTVLDVGTGSGCIAVTLKLELPEATVVASDISEKALRVARENAERLGTEVEFMQADLMEGVDAQPDIIMANLPYVDENWEWVDKEALSSEPSLALYAKDGGLALIKKLIDQVRERGIKHLVLEADPCQHERIREYAKEKGLTLRETRGFILHLE
ncbi:HemK family protein methyltransferase [Candidatus Saccharibacteria bacterium]|nr:HemK family protein methyltransferase [Candidatus Saccharibacteria bacterium]